MILILFKVRSEHSAQILQWVSIEVFTAYKALCKFPPHASLFLPPQPPHPVPLWFFFIPALANYTDLFFIIILEHARHTSCFKTFCICYFPRVFFSFIFAWITHSSSNISVSLLWSLFTVVPTALVPVPCFCCVFSIVNIIWHLRGFTDFFNIQLTFVECKLNGGGDFCLLSLLLSFVFSTEKQCLACIVIQHLFVEWINCICIYGFWNPERWNGCCKEICYPNQYEEMELNFLSCAE